MKLKFFNYATVFGLCFALIQQIIVASSTVMIAKLSQAVISGNEYVLWLILFLLSLTLVYIPTTLTNYFINKAKYITYKNFIENFSIEAYNRPDYFFNSSFREEKESYFTHEAWLIIQENYNFFVDMFSLIFNVGLNVIVMSYYLNMAFLLSYACAIPLTVLSVIGSKKILQKWSDKSQHSKNEMLQMLSSGWDTILIGNEWNASIWKNNFINKCNISDKNQRRLTLDIDIASMITLFVSALPIFIVIFMSFYNAIGNAEKLAVLVATTPRQVITLQHLSDTIGLFVNLNDKIRRTKQLAVKLDFSESLARKGKISWGRVFIIAATNKLLLKNFDDLITYTKNFSRGRYTITGDNGSGKTTLLAEIKSKLTDKAYMLPSQSKMVFLNEINQREFSTGEKAMANLSEIATNVHDIKASVILLDEWNANLDDYNVNNINNIINKISNDVCVIEVLHKF